MTRPVQIARPRSVFTITTIGSSLTPARECAPVRLIPRPADQQPAAGTITKKDRRRARRIGLVLVGVVVDVIILGLGGLALGRSQLGHAVLAAIAAAILALVLVAIGIGGGRVHCPGCPR